MVISPGRGILAALLALTLSMPALAQGTSPAPPLQPSESAWPSGDELRRELQDIGFSFRVDRDSGDWFGWAPRASVVESPALSLGGFGAGDAMATFTFDLLQTDLLGGDVDAALTAFMEVVTRVPIDSAAVERARLFVVNDLLTEPPETLESCYASIGPAGAIVVTIDSDTGLALLGLASTTDDLELDADTEVGLCAPIDPSIDGVTPGDPTSERVTIGTTIGEQPGYDPAEVTVEGTLVTLVLTFRNDSASEQSLTFAAPLESDTGPVPPGEVKLIVVRQLTPGDYPFFSRSDPEAMTGVVRVTKPGSN